MATPITVSPQFKADFEFFCERAGLNNYERGVWRDAVRADFATVAPWITETVSVYRFCDETWPRLPTALPTARLCEGYLASLGWFAEDQTIFHRWSIINIIKLCINVKKIISM